MADNYSNYLETPLADNLETFKTYLEDNWRGRWSDESIEIMRDAYCVGISEMWVDKMLSQSNKVNIYKQIIMKCRNYEVQAYEQNNNAWKEQLIMLRKRYQAELLDALTKIIHYWCMEN